MRGPIMLFDAWALHDAEEALTFPATADYIADLTGIDAVRMSTKQSVAAIVVVGAAHVLVRFDWSSLFRSRIPSRR